MVILFVDSLLQRLSMVGDSPKKATNANPDPQENGNICSASLIELLDGIILLYNIAAHKQLSKVKLPTIVPKILLTS